MKFIFPEVRGSMNAMGPVTYFARDPLRSYFQERRASRLLCTWPIAFILPWTSENWNLFLKSTYPDLNYPKIVSYDLCAKPRLRSACLIRVFIVRKKKPWILSYPMNANRRHWSDLAEAQADVSPRLAHILFCWFCHAKAHKFIACWVDSY